MAVLAAGAYAVEAGEAFGPKPRWAKAGWGGFAGLRWADFPPRAGRIASTLTVVISGVVTGYSLFIQLPQSK